MLAKFVPKRFIVHSFNKVSEQKEFLINQQPLFSAMYFRAAWNPMCKTADVNFQKYSDYNPHVLCTQFDCDQDDFAAKYYAIKHEPEFIRCLYGHEMARVIGDDLEYVDTKMKE